MYFCVSGILPFPSSNEEESEKAICLGKYSFPKEKFSKVSKDCQDLISKLLIKNPNSRLSALQALNHPWLRIADEKCDQATMNETLFRMNSTSKKSKLKEVFTNFMVSQMSNNSEIKVLEKIFYDIDVDKDGTISKDELTKQLSIEMTVDQAEAQAKKMMDCLDNDGSGQIDYTEFLQAAINKQSLLTRENIRKAFYYFDKDGSGIIERDELSD